MTRVSMWIARRPEDELGDAIAAADRRRTMDALKVRHNVVVSSAKPVAPVASTTASECGWCSTRRQLASMPDGASRMPHFGRLMASAAGRRAVGTPCERCIKTALATLKRRVDAGRPKNSGGAAQGAGSLTSSSSAFASRPRGIRAASPGNTLAASAAIDRAHHDCIVCEGMPSHVRSHPSWRTSLADYRRWVASGRPKRWPV